MRVAVGSDDAGFDLKEVTGAMVVADALAAFRAAPEEHGRHDRRIEKLAALDAARAGHRSLEGTP